MRTLSLRLVLPGLLLFLLGVLAIPSPANARQQASAEGQNQVKIEINSATVEQL